jgi:hypothetical protein
MMEWLRGIRGSPWLMSAVSMRRMKRGKPVKIVSLKYDSPQPVPQQPFPCHLNLIVRSRCTTVPAHTRRILLPGQSFRFQLNC